MRIFSTKSYFNLACAHAQYFDEDEDGSPGACASLHGYDRSVHFEFEGYPDEQGWIFPFGELKPVKEFLEYYFDHTSLLPANDPRLEEIPLKMKQPGGILGTIRVLPYGVSMEMSSLFVWEHVNTWMYEETAGRVLVTRVEIKEHERNSGIFQTSYKKARRHAASQAYQLGNPPLKLQQFWKYESPDAAIYRIENAINKGENE